MELLARAGGSAYTIVAFVIGLRLLLLWGRTRALPELLIGLAVLSLAGLGYPLSAVAREAPDLAASTRGVLGATAGLFAVIGVSANTGFTFVLFRRGTPWASGLLAGVVLGSVALFAGQSVHGDWARGGLFWAWLPLWITISFGWACVECGHYHFMLRRRLRLGLADPVVVDRFRLYAAATGLAVLVNLVGWVFFWLDLEMISHPLGGLLLFAFGTTSSVLMLLAFLPPQAYLARVRARSAEAV